MKRLLAILLIVFAAPTMAQTVMDGSDKGLLPEVMKGLKETLLIRTPDPFAAQIMLIHPAPNKGAICGLINLKGKNGAYQGFTAFHYIYENNRNTLYLSSETKISC